MNHCNGLTEELAGLSIDEHSANYTELIECGLSVSVANALDAVLKQELVKFSDLDDRAIEALKELDEEGALAVLKQFHDSNLEVGGLQEFLINKNGPRKKKDDPGHPLFVYYSNTGRPLVIRFANVSSGWATTTGRIANCIGLIDEGVLHIYYICSSHVQNKSAFLCGVMKIHRQRVKHEREGHPNLTDLKKSGPGEIKIKELLDRTHYNLDVTTGQRRYGGPPPKDVYDGPEPGPGCQVFIGRIPRTIFEDELVPLLEKAGIIWDFRLMMDPLTGQNRGFGFVTFINKTAAVACVKILDNYEIRAKRFLGVCVSQSNCRLFVGSIPKTKTKDEILNEFNNITNGLKDVIIYLQTEDKNKNRGFCFLEYVDHKAASQAKRKLSSPKMKAFNNAISVDWADPIDEPSDEIMSKVKVLYIKNLSLKASEEIIMTTFSAYGDVERVKKIKDYAFVHFKERENALKALEELNGLNLEGDSIEISLAKPVDKKKKERQMERKMMHSHMNIGMGHFGPPRSNYPQRGGGWHNRGGYYPPPPPPMGRYQTFADDYFVGDYVPYGYKGFEDPYMNLPPMRSPYNQRPQGMMRSNRGMYGNSFGRGGRGGMANRGRSRGARDDFVMVMS